MKPKEEADVNVQLLPRKGGAKFQTKIDWTTFESTFAKTPDADLSDAIAATLLPFPLRPDQRALVEKQRKPDQSRPEQIHALIAVLMSLPEYQLT